MAFKRTRLTLNRVKNDPVKFSARSIAKFIALCDKDIHKSVQKVI